VDPRRRRRRLPREDQGALNTATIGGGNGAILAAVPSPAEVPWQTESAMKTDKTLGNAMMSKTWMVIPKSLSVLVVVPALGGCAPVTAASSPDSMSDPSERVTVAEPLAPSSLEGALFGRIEVFNDGAPVKSGCTVRLTGDGGSEKAAVSLDEDGWVFTTVTRGLTHVSDVTCAIGVATPSYRSRAHAFVVIGQNKIVYFGHLRIDMHTNPYVKPEPSERAEVGAETAQVARLLVGGILGELIAGAIVQGTADKSAPSGTADVFDRFDDAKLVYEARDMRGESALRPVARIAGEPINAAKLAPPSVAGFTLGDDVAKAEKLCTGAGHTWQKLEAKKNYPKYSCSGPAAGVGAPVTVEIGVCGKSVCKIALDGNPESGAWETVVPRFVELAKPLIQVSGKPHDRSVQPLKDCKTEMEVEKCFGRGRARVSLAWSWNDGRSASVTLDGGTVGKAPTLSLVYRSN
jgi:hypothetical protein